MLKFKVDENLPAEVAGVLAAAGHDAVTVADQQMVGRPDTDLATVCRAEQRAMVTLDQDFADIRMYPPAAYPGIVVFRLARLDKHHVLSVLRRLLPLLSREPLTAKLWIVQEATIRVRG
jgi:predicted nuclease of predicted toxin-antitoxin system